MLKGVFYPKFLPKCRVNQFTISGWKIAVLNLGPGAVLLRRLVDDFSEKVTEEEMKKNFLYEEDYINFAKKNGYSLREKIDHLLYFIPLDSLHANSDLDG